MGRIMNYTLRPSSRGYVAIMTSFLLIIYITSTKANNLMLADQSYNRPLSAECVYPCNCPKKPPPCQGGVTIVKDGCDCCHICARQEGDLCSAKDRCDYIKGLKCNMSLDGGRRGICIVSAGKPCIVNGKTYKNGEEFSPSCNLLCICQNGRYACTSLCPHEERRPSASHCQGAQLISISGRCCKEWVCPHSHSLPRQDDHSGYQEERPSNDRCKKETTAWSACSVTCGMGVSIRVTSDNDECQPKQERRLCMIRPCNLQDTVQDGEECKSSVKEPSPIRLYNGECESVGLHSPKYCTNCNHQKCCGPGKTRTREIRFRCPDDKLIVELMMWIKTCECYDLKSCPL